MSIHERDFVYVHKRKSPLNMLGNILSKLISIGPN